ncbi:UNKNOWN [Stylonychia lemnae]|uniref:Uncharacterized protein n=1 Tax=Stylonychia lemnae TaxID=5949 RepID=A0A078ABG2_STYLE|nr:UNKNOWN [Stylonychia lemnae]|eukprot:CDW79524.1 UNKNOWN [Stylonychia lemnae]
MGIGSFLEDLSQEQANYNFIQSNVANDINKQIGDEMQDQGFNRQGQNYINFCFQMIEMKRNQPRDLHNLQGNGLSLQLGENAVSQDSQKAQKDDKEKYEVKEQMIAEKLEWIRLKKKITNFDELSPLTMNIETIFSLPQEIQINDQGKIISIPNSQDTNASIIKLQQEIETKKQAFKDMLLKNPEHLGKDSKVLKGLSTKRKIKTLEKFVEDLFTDQMEVESWVSAKENIQYQINQTTPNPLEKLFGRALGQNNNSKEKEGGTDPSLQSITIQEQVEIADPMFFRDLGPYSRQLSMAKQVIITNKCRESKLQRKIQKKILDNYVEIEVNQQNLSDEMYLLALSGLVPIDKLIQRMNNMKKWELSKNLNGMAFDGVLETSPSTASPIDSNDEEQVDAENSKNNLQKLQSLRQIGGIQQRQSQIKSKKDIHLLNQEIQKINLFDQRNGGDNYVTDVNNNSNSEEFFDERRPRQMTQQEDRLTQSRIRKTIIDGINKHSESKEELENLKRNALNTRKQTENILNLGHNQQPLSIEELKRQEYINILKGGKGNNYKRDNSSSTDRQSSFKRDRNGGLFQNGLYSQADKFNNNDLSVISEVQLSVADQSMTKEILKTFNGPSSVMNLPPPQTSILKGGINQHSIQVAAFITNESPQLRLKKQKSNIRIEQNPSLSQISLPEYEQMIVQHLKNIDELKHAKRQVESDHQDLVKQKKQTQNLKNMERMRQELNKRIEQNLMAIIKILDDHQERLAEDDEQDDYQQIISNDTILKGSVISSEDIDEQIKAKFLTRLVREYRKNRERAKQQQLREQMEKEIEENIYKRFPSLGTSPDRVSKNSKSRGNSTFRLNNSRMQNTSSLSPPGTQARGASGNGNISSLPSHNNTISLANDTQTSKNTIFGMTKNSIPKRKANDQMQLKSHFENEEITQMKKGWGVEQQQTNIKLKPQTNTYGNATNSDNLNKNNNLMKSIQGNILMKLDKPPTDYYQVNKSNLNTYQTKTTINNTKASQNKNGAKTQRQMNHKPEKNIAPTRNVGQKNNLTSKIMQKGSKIGAVKSNLNNQSVIVKKRTTKQDISQDEPPEQDWIGGGGQPLSDYEGSGEEWVI